MALDIGSEVLLAPRTELGGAFSFDFGPPPQIWGCGKDDSTRGAEPVVSHSCPIEMGRMLATGKEAGEAAGFDNADSLGSIVASPLEVVQAEPDQCREGRRHDPVTSKSPEETLVIEVEDEQQPYEQSIYYD